MWVIADLASYTFGVKIQNREKVGKECRTTTSSSFPAFLFRLFDHTAEFGRGFDEISGLKVC